MYGHKGIKNVVSQHSNVSDKSSKDAGREIQDNHSGAPLSAGAMERWVTEAVSSC
jgi:hypothetical protein